MAAVDPIANIPTSEDVRRMIAEAVRRTELLRQLLRLSLRREELITKSADRKAVGS